MQHIIVETLALEAEPTQAAVSMDPPQDLWRATSFDETVPIQPPSYFVRTDDSNRARSRSESPFMLKHFNKLRFGRFHICQVGKGEIAPRAGLELLVTASILLWLFLDSKGESSEVHK